MKAFTAGLNERLTIPESIEIYTPKRHILKDWCDSLIKYKKDNENTPTLEEEWYKHESIENVPTNGLKYVRTYKKDVLLSDPRGFSFQISAMNFLDILEYENIVNKELSGKYTFAWNNDELLLVPCSSSWYKESIKYCRLKHESKITFKDLVVGATYMVSKLERIYIGCYEWHTTSVVKKGNTDEPSVFGLTHKKYHIFYRKEENKEVFTCVRKSKNIEYLVTDEVHPDIDNLIHTFTSKTPEGSRFDTFKIKRQKIKVGSMWEREKKYILLLDDDAKMKFACYTNEYNHYNRSKLTLLEYITFNKEENTITTRYANSDDIEINATGENETLYCVTENGYEFDIRLEGFINQYHPKQLYTERYINQ